MGFILWGGFYLKSELNMLELISIVSWYIACFCVLVIANNDYEEFGKKKPNAIIVLLFVSIFMIVGTVFLKSGLFK